MKGSALRWPLSVMVLAWDNAMKNDNSRFSFEIPGYFRSAFYAVRSPSDFPKGLEAWVTDHKSGERFQLSDEEDHMMMVLGENLADIRKTHNRAMPLFSANAHWYSSVWTRERRGVVVDHVLTAIVNKRKGDTSEWERLKAMDGDQWIEWLMTELGREKQ